MIDIFESMESAAEQALDDMTSNVPQGKFKCYCGNVDDLSNAMPASNSPYASPMCGECFDKAIEEDGAR